MQDTNQIHYDMFGKQSEQHDQAGSYNSKHGMECTKDIAHELEELYRYSSLKKAHPRTTSQVTKPNQMPSDQSISSPPAPVLFTRKTKKPTLDIDRGKLISTASPAHLSETSVTRVVDFYDAILQSLMYCSGDDDCSLDSLVVDGQLNVER
jgi:hypothetical protein